MSSNKKAQDARGPDAYENHFLLLALISLAAAQKPMMQKDRQVLFDFRVEDESTPAKITPATQRMVLTKVFRRYLIDTNKCNFPADAADDYLGAARKAGQMVPSIADVEADFARNVIKKTDLNSDGIDELLMTTGDMAQGTLTEMASLVSFQNGRRQVLQEFGSVVLDSCASGFPSSTSEASVIYISDVTPGAMPKITQENYSSSCRKTKRWRFVSHGKKED